jgi:uncharacterized membrane protein
MKKINVKLNNSVLLIVGIILLSFLIGAYFFPLMPDKMASHWNIAGEVDGYMPKWLALFLMPMISVIMFLVYLAVPKIDPLNANIDKFRKYYDNFMTIFFLFLLYIYLLTIFWSLDYDFNMVQLLSPAFALLYFYAGVLIENSKRNYSIGIRTPWTVSNEKVWDKTHRVGAMLFKITGIIALLGIALPAYALYFVLIPVLLVAVYTIVYSYLVYRKETGKPKK